MNYKTMLAKVLGEKELAEMNVKAIKDDESLFDELTNKKFLLVVDWSGEDKEGILYGFFDSRLQSMLGIRLDVPEEEVYQKYNQEIEDPQRGDFVPFRYPILTNDWKSSVQELYCLIWELTLITYWYLIKKTPKNLSL